MEPHNSKINGSNPLPEQREVQRHLLAMGQEEDVQRRVCGRGKDRWRGSISWFGKTENTEKGREGVTLRREKRD